MDRSTTKNSHNCSQLEEEICLFVWEIFKVLQCLTNNSIQHVLISLTVLLKVVSGVVVAVGVSYLLLLFIVLLTHGCLTENVYKNHLPGT